jgi:hypothetical protein
MRIIRGINLRNLRPHIPFYAAAIAVFLLSLPVVTPRLYAADEIEYFAYLRSSWFDRDLSFDNEYRHFYDRGIARAWGFDNTFLKRTTATGLRPNYAPVGTAVLWSPFYLIADLATRTASAMGVDVVRDGYSRPYLVAVTYASALYGFLAVVISMSVARTVVGSGRLASAVVWLGTPLIFYMYVAPGYSHACSAFAVAIFVFAWLKVRRTWTLSGVLALGALAGLMAMVREQDAFIAIGPAVDYVVGVVRANRTFSANLQYIGKAAAGLAAFSVAYLPQAAAYLILNGRIGPDPMVQQKMIWSSPHALRVLFSPDHGAIFWTPLLMLAGLGLIAVALGRAGGREGLDAKWIATLMLLMVATQIYVSGSISTWSAAGSFGQRRFIGLTVFLAVGVAGFIRGTSSRAMTPVLTLMMALCVWWNVGLMAQFGSGTMDRQRLELGRNTYNNFVAIPRNLPDLVYRYLFDRSSFYKSAHVDVAP